jgi:predicted acyl esterase
LSEARSEIRDGIQIDWDVAIEMNDGVIIHADVFRPVSMSGQDITIKAHDGGDYMGYLSKPASKQDSCKKDGYNPIYIKTPQEAANDCTRN